MRLWAGGLAWSGRGQAGGPLWKGQTDWYLQFSEIVQSSERIGGYGSNLIVLQAPVKMIIKRETMKQTFSLERWREFCAWMMGTVTQ